jgi:chemotaxis protein MotB
MRHAPGPRGEADGRRGAGGRNVAGGTDRWLVSYADLMTLLLAFFATMYAMSEVKANKAEGAPTAAKAAAPARNGAVDLREQLSSALAPAIATGQVDLYEDPRGIVMSLPERATFPVAGADVMAEAGALLGTIAETIAPLEAEIRVEGHTDDVPIRTARYSSNWELSTARASAVVALFIARGIEPRRLSAAGYGEFHPLATNADAAGRARNRRVDLVVRQP